MTAPDHPAALYSIESEDSVVGALLLSGEAGSMAWDRVSGVVSADDFFVSANRMIFAAVRDLAEAGKPCDTLTVAGVLKDRGQLADEDVGGIAGLQSRVDGVPSVANVHVYAGIVREHAIRRAIFRAAERIQASVVDSKGKSAAELLDGAQALMLAAGDAAARRETDYVTLESALGEVMQHLDAAATAAKSGKSLAIGTGFASLDRALGGGFYPGELIVLGAGPSQGKSAFAMGIAEHVATALQRSVGVHVMEMPAAQIAMRALAGASHVNAQRLREGRIYEADWDKLNPGLAKLSPLPIYIDATAELSIDDIRSRVRRLVRRCAGDRPLGLIVVDYLQLLKVNERENRVTEIGKISRGLKGLAMQLKVPVLALSSLNRERFKRNDKRPTMGDLRESGDIEADADVIMFLHREDMYHPERQDLRGSAELIIAKQRSGQLCTVPLTFRGDFTKFVDPNDDPAAYAKARGE